MVPCQAPRQLLSSVLISSAWYVCYYWLHESHVALMVSDLNKTTQLTGEEDEKDF